MKIAFIVTNISSEGGTERVVVNLCNFLAACPSYSIDIHSLTSEGGPPFFTLDDRVRIVHHKLVDYAKERWVFLKFLRKVRNTIFIFSEFKRINADILVGTSKHINIYMVLFKHSGAVKKIGCEHFAHNAPMSAFVRVARKALYPSLDTLVVLNRADYAYYRGFMQEVVLIPNFIFFTPSSPAVLHRKLALAVGRHSYEKGFDTLLAVWEMVHDRHPDWKLKIVGSGPLLLKHTRLCQELGLSDVVEFASPTKAILKEYENASLYILSSRTEAFPMALLEAMAFGLPCVSFDCDAGPRDILSDGQDGFLVPPGQNAAMADVIHRLIEDPGLRKQVGMKAFEDCSRFYLDHIGHQWIDLFERITTR